MKLALIFCAASVLAHAPPRIELQLDGYASPSFSLQEVKLTKFSSTGQHSLGYKQPNGDRVGQRQDWTQRCPASSLTTADNCPIPEALAFDHNDKSIQVTRRIDRIDLNNAGGAAETNLARIDYTVRSTYLVYFDAEDSAHNHAEQIVFAIILDDTTKPVITQCKTSKTYIEASTADWSSLCWDDTAKDNYDGNLELTTHVKYTIQQISGADGYVGRFLKCAGSEYCTTANVGQAFNYEGDNTITLGVYTVVVFAHDDAGDYGHHFKDNEQIASRTVIVRDTTKPVISVNCTIESSCTSRTSGQIDPMTKWECGTTYEDEGASSTDTYDPAPSMNSDGSDVKSDTVGTYEVVYTSSDSAWDYELDAAANNEAVKKKRKVVIEDTVKPVIELSTGSSHCTGTTSCNLITFRSAKDNRFAEFIDPGAECTDVCDKRCERGNCTESMHWNKKFNDQQVGEYKRTYTCEDKSGNMNEVVRTFHIVDSEAPIVHLVGKNTLTVEASRTETYADQGASCEDFHHDNIVPESTGDEVNLAVTGEYQVQYTCADPTDNPSYVDGLSSSANRTVVVKDRLCPKITLKGDDFVYIEAGFEYIDAGATASDLFDGDIPEDQIDVKGNNINTKNAFYSRKSCAEIAKAYNDVVGNGTIPDSGNYYITRFTGPENNKQLQRDLVWCDFETEVTIGGNTYTGWTYKAITDGEAVTYQDPQGNPAAYPSEGSCAQYGMKIARFNPGNTFQSKLREATQTEFCTHKLRGSTPTCKYEEYNVADVTSYLCEVPMAVTDFEFKIDSKMNGGKGKIISSVPTHAISHDQISHAEQGKYVIEYRVTDKADNPQCEVMTRTVVVKDTLPPVIMLHWGNPGAIDNLLHKSDDQQRGIGNVQNRPWDPLEPSQSEAADAIANGTLTTMDLAASRSLDVLDARHDVLTTAAP